MNDVTLDGWMEQRMDVGMMDGRFDRDGRIDGWDDRDGWVNTE